MLRNFVNLLFLLLISQLAWAQKEINFALLTINGEQRDAYYSLVRDFEKEYPSIKVNIQAAESETYKKNIEKWLQQEQFSDVMFWFGGERLNWYVKRGWVKSINTYWHHNQWDNHFSNTSISAVTIDDNKYALPIHYYHWGIYYNKKLFKQFELDIPKTWEEFLAVCRTLKKNNIAPIALGSSEAWPLAGWFDYINLRLNGLGFHKSLMEGRHAYTSKEVIEVFSYWKQLTDPGYYLSNHSRLNWREALPYLYRDLAAMYLMGNFWTSQIPSGLEKNFGVFQFPILKEEVGVYEEAPTDVLFIPSNVKNFESAKVFLEYMSRPSVQQALNKQLGMLSPVLGASVPNNEFLKVGADYLARAEGASQFFDRDNPQPIAIEGMKLMQRFLSNPNALPVILRDYEVLRMKSFRRKH